MASEYHIRISTQAQTLALLRLTPESLEGGLRWAPDASGTLVMQTLISSSKNGVGQQQGSYQTPHGRHQIRAKIGAGSAWNTVFVGRRKTGEIWSPALAGQFPQRDWILTRILWLSGLEPGKNRFGEVDTMRRYIYLHGSPDTAVMGEPGSIGCIRMKNSDIVSLFDWAPVGTTVDIS
ncbi:MAG: L,D-transpeptidase [Betaproteobacteria bacterium]|jgi:lipoprotein-anchoring transpeptidase ErfK/SrfK|nr:L,D-transpeptidase [Betaproteobacteria bacterium]